AAQRAHPRVRARVRPPHRRRPLRDAAHALAGALLHHLGPRRRGLRVRALDLPAGRAPARARHLGRMKIAVVGEPGAWSTEGLGAGRRGWGATTAVVALAACSLRLPDPRLFHRGEPLDGLDGAVVKKLGDTADGWGVQERIGMLRHLEATGVPVLSAPDRLHVAVNRYRMTCELVRAGLPVPETTVTEDIDAAAPPAERYGSAA